MIDRYSGMQVESRNDDKFLLLSLLVLFINFGSQLLSFPLQSALIIYAVIKADIRLFPGLFLVMLDKSNFRFFGAGMVKLQVGFAVSPQNIFLLMCFAVCIFGIVRQWYDRPTLMWFVPWLLCIIPALAMAMPARQKGLTMLWQVPLVTFLAPSLYFWGIKVGKTWDVGKEYFISRMILILAIINGLELIGLFHIFTFAEHITIISLCFGCFFLPKHLFYKVASFIGAAFAMGCVLFGRYLAIAEKQGFSSSAEIGTTFSRLLIVIIGIAFMIYLLGRRISESVIRVIPYMALVFCICVMSYAIGRAGSAKQSDVVENKYQSFLERFEYKLVGDRGTVWSEGLRETLMPPYFIKNLDDQLVMGYNYATGKIEPMVKLLPHNQVLTLLARSGWWLGLFMILFLWWACIRSFKSASYMLNDKILLCTLLAPYAAIFIVVGLTGQTVLNHLFCSNGLVTMIYPGMIYGVWQKRQQLRFMSARRW